MKIIVKKKEIGGLLPVGEHAIVITEVTMELAKENDTFADRTPQLKIVGKNASGSITAWMNLRGYKNSSDFEGGVAPKGFEFRSYDENSEKFLTDKKTGKRVASEERTNNLLENIGNLAYAAGIDSEEIDLEELATELEGAEVGVRIKENSRGKLEVSYFMPVEEVKASAKIED